jgi:hypothetical protein
MLVQMAMSLTAPWCGLDWRADYELVTNGRRR